MAMAATTPAAVSLFQSPSLRLLLRPPLRWTALPPRLPVKTSFARIRSISSSLATPGPPRPATRGDVLRGVLRILEPLRKPVIAAILVSALVLSDPFAALAASGGRIGGSAFSSRSSSGSSSSSSSWVYSSPSPGVTGGLYSAPFYSSSSFVTVSPALGFGFGAGSSVFLVMMGFTAFLFLTGFLSDSRGSGSVLTETQKTSVIKLQVGLLGMARSFQRDLDQLAEKADTSTPAGLSFVLTEASLALLRHPDCCVSAYSSVDVKRSVEGGERRFNQLSIEERGKFDEETLVNLNNIKRHKTSGQRSSSFSNEYIVVTILAAVEGVYKIPAVNSSADLKTALQELGSLPSSKIQAVEILWTPQNENDTLSERELLEDYPLLRPL